MVELQLVTQFAEHGVMPQSGGLLDQSYQCITLISAMKREQGFAQSETISNGRI